MTKLFISATAVQKTRRYDMKKVLAIWLAMVAFAGAQTYVGSIDQVDPIFVTTNVLADTVAKSTTDVYTAATGYTDGKLTNYNTTAEADQRYVWTSHRFAAGTRAHNYSDTQYVFHRPYGWRTITGYRLTWLYEDSATNMNACQIRIGPGWPGGGWSGGNVWTNSLDTNDWFLTTGGIRNYHDTGLIETNVTIGRGTGLDDLPLAGWYNFSGQTVTNFGGTLNLRWGPSE